MLFWNANVMFIWCINVKEGVMQAKISFESLFESTNYARSVGPLSNVEPNNTKTTLSHSNSICNSNDDVWSITRNPQCEAGTRGPLQSAIVMTLIYSSTPNRKQRSERAWPLHWNHYCGEEGRCARWDASVCLMHWLMHKNEGCGKWNRV